MAKRKTNGGAKLGYEEKLWLAADKLRSNMDVAEYNHMELGLIVPKCNSNHFEEHYTESQLQAKKIQFEQFAGSSRRPDGTLNTYHVCR